MMQIYEYYSKASPETSCKERRDRHERFIKSSFKGDL
jgi:hypothetical protein